MHAILTNEQTGQLKDVKVGFSWTMFFWGFWPCLFRGDWKWCAITLLAQGFSFGAFPIVFAFLYNKLYINDMIANGWVPNSDADYAILQAKCIYAPSPYNN